MNNSRERLSHLTPQQRALLEQRLLGRPHSRPASVEAADASPKPLSFAQESLWLFGQLSPEAPLYNMPQAFRLTGPLDRGALESAFSAIVRRHEALRTKFCALNGARVQTPQDRAFSLKFVDLTTAAPAERETALERFLHEEATTPFVLSEDLMIRAGLVRLGDDDHVLTITLHHIVADFASLGLLFKELSALYHTAGASPPPVLPPLPVSFPVWAARQRHLAEGTAMQGALAYWKERLAGQPPVLEMPTDRPRGSARLFHGARHPVHISPALTASLRTVAQAEAVTLYMLLLAAFQTLLFRYSGQQDILVGSPMDCRSDPATQPMIGLLLNTVVLRTDCSGDPTFRQLLHRVRNEAVGAFAHQELPFERLVEELHLPRQPGVNPLCQVMFQYLAASWPKLELPGLSATPLPMETNTAKFELTLTLLECDSGLTGELEYDTDLFEAATALRLVNNYIVLLESIAADPGEPITQLRLLSSAEMEQVLVTANQTQTPYPREACIHRLFEEQARARPDTIAVVTADHALTYSELNRRANSLARRLQHQSVRAGDRVGFCLDRSPELIVALLAILKAGAAYVPLDPAFPLERSRYMLNEARVSALLTVSRYPQVAALSDNAILLDAGFEEQSASDEANLTDVVKAADLAYVLYTSGSTGQPKGVAVPHRAVVRLVKDTHYASFDASEVFLQFAPLTFDASTFEIWGPLLNGGRLVLFPPLFESLEQLLDIVNAQAITTLWLTAGLFHQVVEEHLSRLHGLKQLLAGGDVLSPSHVTRALKALSRCQLINGYGPTENTTFTCCYRFPQDWPGKTSAPIGRPISNTRVYVLDPHLNPVPIGVRGELYAAGDGLADGYLNASELTEQKFIRDPFSPDPSARMYRTGDQARMLADGNLEFLGRLDDQVKVNGFRVHLSEVEGALQTLPGVRHAGVTVRNRPGSSLELVAHIVPGTGLSLSEVRNAAVQALPAYMVPAHFVQRSDLPLTPNGKIDRRALSAAYQTEELSPRLCRAAETPLQEQILTIWKEVFARDDIGIDDNFFDLGGHSLLATRVVSRLNQALQRNVSLGALFEAPTVSGFADRIANLQPDAGSAPIPRRTRPRPSQNSG